MLYKEFIDALGELQAGQKIYLKPAIEPILNAYDPLVKHKIFEVSPGPGGEFRLRFLTIMQELYYSKTQLEQMFIEKGWQDYTFFNLMDDFNEWQKRA